MLPHEAWARSAAIGDLLPGLRYAIAYGSHAAGCAHPDSDLDLLFVTRETPTPQQLSQVTKAVIALHEDYSLTLDTEVAFEVKLTASRTDVAMALSLAGFATTGGISVPPVDPAPAWLNGPQFRFRLILGALTGPHVFLTGDLHAYRADQARADNAVALVAIELLLDNLHLDLADVTTALLAHPDGSTVKDHLGYRDGPHLVSMALRAITRLQTLGCLNKEGDRWSVDRARVTQQVNTIVAAYPDHVQATVHTQKEHS
jgi:arginyl-tRNA synthetase